MSGRSRRSEKLEDVVRFPSSRFALAEDPISAGTAGSAASLGAAHFSLETAFIIV